MKFTIRDLLLVTVIVALAVVWFVEHRRQAAECEEQRIVYERAVSEMEGWANSLSTDYGIEVEFRKQGGIKGVTQYGRRIPPIIKLPKTSAPTPRTPKNQESGRSTPSP